MLDTLFSQILNMSFTASYVILFVWFVRLLLKKAPKIFSYMLWSVALFRLVCPFSFESNLSWFSLSDTSTKQMRPFPKTFTTLNNVFPMQVPENFGGALSSDTVTQPHLTDIFPVIWLVGIVVLLVYSIVSLLKLRHILKDSVHENGNIYTSATLTSPFVIGVFLPKIYLPSILTDSEKKYILLHERTHLKRFDHVVKILSFFVLCLHWFNPLVWIAFFLSGRDMEMSCDEQVIKVLGNDVKKNYSSSLLSLATGRKIVGGTPLAFGEGDTKSRIKNVLNYKRPAFWIISFSIVVVVIVAIILVANPKEEPPTLWAMRPMVMLDGVLYLDTNRDVSAEIDDSVILGEIKSTVATSQKPTEDEQCNFNRVGAKYVAHEDGIAVFFENEEDKWIFFEKENPSSEPDIYVPPNKPLQELPKEYPPSVAIENGDYVNVHGVVSNVEVMNEFIQAVSKKEKAFVRTTRYTTEGDPIIYDFYFDGKTFSVFRDTTRDKFGEQKIEQYTFSNLVEFTRDTPEKGKFYYVTDLTEITVKDFDDGFDGVILQYTPIE